MTELFPCPECENAALADIVFLFDGSSSITSQNFNEYRHYLRNIIRALDIGPNKVRIGLAQYSDDFHQEFLLKDHMDRKSLLAAVEAFSQHGGGKKTGQAINFLKTNYFTKEAGSRIGQRVPQIAVVITDGESTDDVVAPARDLRRHGVFVFAIGVGRVHHKQLVSIANWPPERFHLTSQSYQSPEDLSRNLLKSLCLSMEEQKKGKANHRMKYIAVHLLM